MLWIVTEHDSRNTQVSMFLWRKTEVAIKFTDLLLVACKQYLYVATWDGKNLWLSSGDIKMKTHKMQILRLCAAA